MNRYLFSIVVFLFSELVFGRAVYNSKDFSPERIQLIKSIAGVYTNSKGDTLKVEFNVLKGDGQLDLFGPMRFEFFGLFEVIGPQDFGFSLDSFKETGNGDFQFSDIENDCDNPGCSNYEVFFNFKNVRSGKPSVSVSTSVETHAEDLFYILEENSGAGLNDLNKLLDKGCKDLYGSKAYLLNFINTDNGAVYCGHTEEVILIRAN